MLPFSSCWNSMLLMHRKKIVLSLPSSSTQCSWYCFRPTVKEASDAALAGDPESAFGGVLASNREIDTATAEAIQEIFSKC